MDFFDLSSLKADAAQAAFDRHESMVEEYLTLLGQGYVFQIGFSGGKDSTCVLNGVIDAMRRAIEIGLIEQDHPLVVISVDTLLEPEPLQAYLPFAHQSIKEACASHNINNLHIEIVSPPIYKQLMILYAGAQKLPATSASGRNADCSIIWKVEVAIAALKRIKAGLALKYQHSAWISLSGSRTAESSRRSNNMSKQGVKNLKALGLIERVESLGDAAAGKVFKFAPIEDWDSAEVISYLNHCGEYPMMKTPINKKISAYGKNFGLLMAIYGEGSNEVCEIDAQDDENKAEQKNCGRIARFGCVTCGMIEDDKSSIELKKYPRWARFGDNTRRFRDYLVRVSSDVKFRALHARAYDPSGNNNVYLQPNTLRASVLEKMVWYASQITIDSRAIHEEALERFRDGKIEFDIGVIDIMQDSTLSSDVKQQYKEMYVKRLLEKPMFELFTEQHAVLLSLLWALHGVSTLPYRAVAILDNVKKGKRIPFPLTNAELNVKRAKQGLPVWNDPSVLNNTIPDALVAQLFSPAKKSFTALKALHGDKLNESHLQDLMPFSINEAWQPKGVHFNAFGQSYNHTQSKAKETRAFKLAYSINVETLEETINATDKVTGRKINTNNNQPLLDALLELGRDDYQAKLLKSAEDQGMPIEELEQLRKQQGGLFGVTRNHAFNNQYVFTSDIKFVEKEKLRKRVSAGKKASARKRHFNKKTSRFEAGRASLKVYSSSVETALEKQAIHTVQYWLPDFSVTRQSAIDIHDYLSVTEEQQKQSFVFDVEIFNQWLSMGGWAQLIADHNTQLRMLINERRPVRSFGGTAPVYYLTNNSGLTATIHFQQYMLETLKRTELFDNAKLFSLAALPYEKIATFKGIVSMSEHRKQKVQHLLAIRYLKNKRRNAIKSVQNKTLRSEIVTDAVININTRVSEFFEQYKRIAEMYVAASALYPFSTDAKSRMQKIEIWLNEFNPVLLNVDNALNLLATSQEREIVNSDYDAKLIITRLYQKERATVLTSMRDFVKTPIKAIDLIKKSNLEGEVFAVSGHYEAKGKVSEAIESLSKWIAGNYPRVNSFLIGSGLTTCLARMAKLPYVCPVIGSPESANTTEKINKRSEKALSDITSLCDALSLNQPALSTLMASGVTNKLQENHSLINISTQAQSIKLSSLMTDKVNIIMQLRAKQQVGDRQRL